METHPGGNWLAVECGGRLGLFGLARPVQLRTLNLGGGLDAGRAMTKELENPEFERKFADLKQRAPAGFVPMLEKLLSAEKEVCRQDAPLPLERLLALEFTPDGRWLICGTSEGVRVFDCSKLCDPQAKVVKWDFTAAAEEPDRTLDKWATKQVHCVGFDSVRQRVLFSGEEGKLKYLELGTGQTGDLLGGPERTPITRFSLSAGRKVIALTRVQGGHGNDRRARFQIWNYPALCAAAGVEF